MKRFFSAIIVAISIHFFWPTFAKTSPKDEVLLTASNVTVSHRAVENLSFGEIRATGEIDATPEEVFALLWDISSYKDFMSMVRDSSNLSLDTNIRTDHIVFAGSFPGVKDRDVVSETKITVQSDQKIAFQYRQLEGVGPAPKKDVVRLTLREGGWELIAIDGGKRTRANYRFRSDPGVEIGIKILQNFTAKSVVELYESIRARLKKK
jgi:uncharacterized protein YndB with AHSA1/START domain